LSPLPANEKLARLRVAFGLGAHHIHPASPTAILP
jgi:hypothetical protein